MKTSNPSPFTPNQVVEVEQATRYETSPHPTTPHSRHDRELCKHSLTFKNSKTVIASRYNMLAQSGLLCRNESKLHVHETVRLKHNSTCCEGRNQTPSRDASTSSPHEKTHMHTTQVPLMRENCSIMTQPALQPKHANPTSTRHSSTEDNDLLGTINDVIVFTKKRCVGYIAQI